MAVTVKICGVNSAEAARAAAEAGAGLVGFVFYAPSPRFVTAEQAAGLAALIPAGVLKVGLFVDAGDADIARMKERVALDMLQLHGAETPSRVAEVKARFGLPVMKAVPIAAAADVEAAKAFETVADRLLFDAKPPKTMVGALPGGNALAFDWQLLSGRRWKAPWMLSGGLTAENLAEAVRISGARAVDVSSGVEDRPGHKDPTRIRAFLAAAKGL
ncbi:MAG: phosphoribosylanthranilate isomerase [Alphaproteobacteria bacterium]